MADFFGSAYLNYWHSDAESAKQDAKQSAKQSAKQDAIKHVRLWGWEQGQSQLKTYLDTYYKNNATWIFKSQFCEKYKQWKKNKVDNLANYIKKTNDKLTGFLRDLKNASDCFDKELNRKELNREELNREIQDKNYNISCKCTLKWARDEKEAMKKWSDEELDDIQKKTREQIIKDIDRNGGWQPLIYVLKKLAENPPKGYTFAQDHPMFLRWLLQKGLIDLSNDDWIYKYVPKLETLYDIAQNLDPFIKNYKVEDLKTLINLTTVKNLRQNLTFLNNQKRETLERLMNGYVSTKENEVYLREKREKELKRNLNDHVNAKEENVHEDLSFENGILITIIQNFLYIEQCKDEMCDRFFVKGEQMTSEVLFGYVINIIKEAGKPKKQKKKKLKK